jgi:fumarate hydratase subunit beta
MILRTPLERKDVEKLKLGDSVYISGKIYTARDKAHLRLLDFLKRGKRIPFDLEGSVIYHCGPVARRKERRWEIIAAGPTTSARMNFAWRIISEGVRAIIGKGGMDGRTKREMKRIGCVYLAYPGGAGALAAKRIKKVLDIYWDDLGMTEAVWCFHVEKFGPAIVAIDSNGESLYKK